MKPKTLVLLSLLLIIIASGVTVLIYYATTIHEIATFEMYGEVGNKIGVAGDTDAIYFGIIPPGAMAQKRMNVTNTHHHALRVSLLFTGEIAPFVFADSNNFVLDPGDTREVKLLFHPSIDTDYGNYAGRVKVTLAKRW